jgi:hypothetical protein
MESGENKFIFLIILGVFILLGSSYFISANSIGASIGGPRTLVNGAITDATNGNAVVPGAKVTVVCVDSRHVRKTITKKTTSLSDGTYSVVFDTKLQCKEKDEVLVSATEGGLSGENTGEIDKGTKKLDVSVVNVSIVPEFGVVAGTLTVLGAVCLFFIIRKKHHVRIKKK